jgi:hypothetical protein
MLKSLAIGVAALALCCPAAALAHEEGSSGFDYYWDQARSDRAEHCDYHAEEREAHAEAHAEGFWSSSEHDAWHRDERAAHRALHDDHRGTSGRGCGGWYGRYDSYGGYGSDRGRSGYGRSRFNGHGDNGAYGYDYSY